MTEQHDPSALGAIKALLERHMATSEQRHTESARHWGELHATVKHQANQITDHHGQLTDHQARIAKVEAATAEIRNMHATFEGSVARELSQVAQAVSVVKNDSAAQNKILSDQNAVLKKQDEALVEIKQGTAALVKESAFRQEAAERRAKWLAKWTPVVKFFAVLVGLVGPVAGLVWAVLQYVTQHRAH